MKKIFVSAMFLVLLLIQSISFASSSKVVTVVHYNTKDISPAVSAVMGEEIGNIVNDNLRKYGIEADTVGNAWETFTKDLDKSTLSKAETYFKWQNVLASSYDTTVNVTIDKFNERDGYAAVSARMSIQRASSNMSAMSSFSSSRMIKGSKGEALKLVLDELTENLSYMLKD